MWSKVAEEMSIPWRAAEAMHWQLGEYEMARRVVITPSSLASASLEPPSTKIPRPSHAGPGSRTPSQDTEPISQSPLKGQEYSPLPTKTEPPLFHKAHSEDHQGRHQGKEASSRSVRGKHANFDIQRPILEVAKQFWLPESPCKECLTTRSAPQFRRSRIISWINGEKKFLV